MFNRFLLTSFLLTSRRPLAFGIIASVVFAGCASTTEIKNEPKLPRRFVSTVSSSSGTFTPSRTTPIQWNGSLEITDSAKTLTPGRSQVIVDALKEEMKKRGYQLSAQASGARFEMKAVLLMGKDADRQQLQALSGAAPELEEGDHAHSGALGVYFTDTDTQLIVWRTATEIVTQSQMPEEQQIERIRYAVQQMLSGLPNAK